MKIGDLVQYREESTFLSRHCKNLMLVISVEYYNETDPVYTLLMDNGNFVECVWEEALEVIHESR